MIAYYTLWLCIISFWAIITLTLMEYHLNISLYHI